LTTFGYRESDEVRAAIDTLATRNDVDAARFGLWGYNLGAYAALARGGEGSSRARAGARLRVRQPETDGEDRRG